MAIEVETAAAVHAGRVDQGGEMQADLHPLRCLPGSSGFCV
jgi:hypothetical protein